MHPHPSRLDSSEATSRDWNLPLVTDLTALYTDLVRAETRLYNRVDARLRAEHGMTLGTLEFLQIIDRRPACRVYDIAHEVDITVGATSKGVDRLEAKGWCERRSNPDDRRSSLLALTPAGRRALAEAVPTFDAAMAELVAGLPRPLLDQLAEGLRRWRHHLEQRPTDEQPSQAGAPAEGQPTQHDVPPDGQPSQPGAPADQQPAAPASRLGIVGQA
jgi:DNA-binding MarR family transcriptional regulator